MFAGLILGIVALPVPEEALLTFSGHLVYKGTFAFVSIGYFFGEQWDSAAQNFSHHWIVGVTVVAIVLAAVLLTR